MRRQWDWVPAAAFVGLVLGLTVRARAQATCAAVLPAGVVRLEARLADPVRSGVARIFPEGCAGPLAVRIRGEVEHRAGSIFRVEGRWIPSPRWGGRPDGLLVAQRVDRIGEGPTAGDRIRNLVVTTTDRLYGSRAALVDALLIGRRGGIDPSLNAAFARSGLVHLLSISGFHVGVIFGWTLVFLRLTRLPRPGAQAVAVALVVLYVALLGWPAPAARAALLCLVVAWSSARQRQPAAGPLLAVTCLLVSLLDPWAVFDLSAWLSAAALAGATAATRWSDRAIGKRAAWRMLFASAGATLATAPLTAAALGSVALAGLALNFAAIPLAAFAVPVVLASVLLGPAEVLAESLAAAGGSALAALELLARTGSTLPYGAFTMVASPAAALPWLGVLGIACWVVGQRNTAALAVRRTGYALGCVGLATLLPNPLPAHLSPLTAHGLSLHFLNVGQGDATLIRTPGDRWILVDAGPAARDPAGGFGRDAGREVVAPFLVRHGVRRLAAFVLSHAHLDHGGGAAAVLGQVPADVVLDPAVPVAEPHYLELLDLIGNRGMRWRPARAGDSLVIDGVRLHVMHPDTAWTGWRSDLNDDSVVLLIRSGSFQAVLAGDLGVRAESLLARRIGPVDLLKVGHHGSAGSSGSAWLAELAPRVGIVSVGANRYGHPAPRAMARLADAGVEVWRTDRQGTIDVSVNDRTMTVRGRRVTRVHDLRPRE